MPDRPPPPDDTLTLDVDQPSPARPNWASGLRAAGSALVQVGAWTGRKAQGLYTSLDPALRQHLAESSVVGLTAVAQNHTPPVRFDTDEARATVFVHGLGGHRGNFVPMQRYFAHRGIHNTVSVGFADKTSIEAMAHHLVSTVRQITEQNDLDPEKPIDIVAHSMGGIIARAALLEPDVLPQVRRLVTIATPHKGTELARFLNTAKVRDLQPGSPLLARLDEQGPWPHDDNTPELLCVWSSKDLVVMPPQNAILDGARAVELSDCSHNGFLVRPAAIRAIFELASA